MKTVRVLPDNLDIVTTALKTRNIDFNLISKNSKVSYYNCCPSCNYYAVTDDVMAVLDVDMSSNKFHKMLLDIGIKPKLHNLGLNGF